MKRTPWFSAHTKPPRRHGWYEVKCSSGMWGAPSGYDRLYFRLDHWFLGPLARSPVSFGLSCDRWRGLLKGR